jgi:hypothetical protein
MFFLRYLSVFVFSVVHYNRFARRLQYGPTQKHDSAAKGGDRKPRFFCGGQSPARPINTRFFAAAGPAKRRNSLQNMDLRQSSI